MLCERPCLVYPLLLDLPDRTETCRRQPGPWATENTCDRRGGTEGRRGWSVCTLSSKAMIFYKPCPSSHLEATGISGGMPELAGLHSRNRTPRPHRGDRSDLGASLMGVVHFGNPPPAGSGPGVCTNPGHGNRGGCHQHSNIPKQLRLSAHLMLEHHTG